MSRIGNFEWGHMFDLELMRRLSDAIMSEDEVRSARDGREYEEGSEQPLEGRKPTHTVPQLSDDALRDLVSPEAQDAIVGFEVTSKAAYEKRYLRPIAPAGDSGVTVGIGYDLGYNTPESVRRDFGSLLSGSDVELLVRATGLKGNSARQRLPEFQGVIVPWEAAIAVFKRTTLPKFAKAVLETFPNTVELKGHAFGALTSLVYNRGTRLDGDRRREMAAIHDLLSNRHFNQVAAQIRAMTRLWEGQANLGGVVKRRLAEAILFEQGLEQMKRPVAVASAETQRFESKSTTAEIIASLEGDGTFYVEEPDTGAFRESATWSKVTWAEDAKSPDYRHITRVPADVALIGRTFEIGPAELELLFRANAFEPSRSYGRVIFALRGAELVTSLTSPQRMERQEGQEKLTLRDVRPDHKSSRCIIGVYDVDRQHLSAYAGSTVPNRRAVALHVEGKMRANMIPTGCYRFELGWHQWSEAERRIPGCLIEAGRTKCVIRSSNDYMYGVDDEWDNAAPCGDNLHPAKSDTSAPFSSFGCLVVAGNVDPSTGGDRANVKHTGDWARFRRAMGFAETGTAGHGREYDVVLLTGLDAAIAHSLVAGRAASDDGQVLNRIGRLRQGSRGDRVRRFQSAFAQPASGMYDHAVTKWFAEWQKSKFASADGMFTPALDQQFGHGIFQPGPNVFASNERMPSGGAAIARKNQLSDVNALYYELGLYDETARRTRTLPEDIKLERLGATHLEFGMSSLKALGANIAQKMEEQLHGYVCGQGAIGQLVDRDALRQRVDQAAKDGGALLREVLVGVLHTSSAWLVPRELIGRVVDALMERLVAPALGSSGAVALQQIDGGVVWLCQRWSSEMGTRHGEQPAHSAVGPKSPASTSIPVVQPSNPTFASAGPAQKTAQLLAAIEQCSVGVAADVVGVRRGIQALRDHLTTSTSSLSPVENSRLLNVLCDSRFMDSLAGPSVPDPYVVIGDIEAAVSAHNSGKTPLGESGFQRSVTTLHDMLADARMPVHVDHIATTLKALTSVKRFDALSTMADRFVARDPRVLGLVSAPYAQGLIDSGRIVAGIEVLHAALDNGALTAGDVDEANGLLGRGHKQIYVNHVRSPSDAVALGEPFAIQLKHALNAYRSSYDPGRPARNFYQGINYIALLKRAQRDRVNVGEHPAPDALARAMIDGLEPTAKASNNLWVFGTLGEAYLALGDIKSAANWYGEYAKHPKIDGFALNSAVRQLEEVWQLKAGTSGAASIVTGLKSALAQAENGRLRLDLNERRLLQMATSSEFQNFFETRTDGGKFVKLAELQRICRCAAAVTGIRSINSRSADMDGTGFLIRGSDLDASLDGAKSYLLTNAHVIWDAERGAGVENGALAPNDVEIRFEGDSDSPSDVLKCARVIWQSNSSLHDATLIELDRRVPDRIAPLQLAPRETALVTDTDGKSKGTRLAVIGHPEGGPLSIGVSGDISEMKATLLDKGPRGNSANPEYLHYRTPTEPGNSGSPVFEVDTWQVVGLHHAGFDEKQGRPRLGGKAGRHLANEGIWIDSIRSAVREEIARASGKAKQRRKWF